MRISSSMKNSNQPAPPAPPTASVTEAAAPAVPPAPSAPAANPSKEVVLAQSPSAPPTPGGTATRSTLLSQLRADMASSLKRHDAPVLKDVGEDAKAAAPAPLPAHAPVSAAPQADDRLTALERAVSELVARLPPATVAAVPTAASSLPGETTPTAGHGPAPEVA